MNMDKESKDKAWNALEKLVKKGCAVAVREVKKDLFHVRVVRDERISESEATSVEEALLTVGEPKTKTMKEVEA